MDDKLTIIIPTKDREQVLLNCIWSILKQSVRPHELIIVDDGNLDNNNMKEILANNKVKYVYIKKSKPGAARSRNMGLKEATGNIIMFLDDDVILDKDYVKHVLEIFKNDVCNKIGGVGGDIINIEDRSLSFSNKMRQTIEKIFLIRSDDQGTILPSGFDVPVGRANHQKKVEILPGCNMSFRRNVFDSFDEIFDGYTGYAHGEDTDFSYRISRKYEIIVTPLAKMVHLRSPIGRMNPRQFTSHMIANRSYFFSKNIPRTAKNRLCFLWAMFGLFCITVLRFMIKPNKERLQEILGWIDAFKYTGANKTKNPKSKQTNTANYYDHL